MSESPLSVAEFERLLSRGRGKAILHLKQHDAAPYREAIRNCALTDVSYDSQCGGTHHVYYGQVIELSGDVEAICSEAIHYLHDNDEDFDFLFALMAELARKGFKSARQAMYAWCRIHYDPREMYTSNLVPLLELDGIEAFLFLLDPRESGVYPEIVEDDISFFGYPLTVLEEKLGKAETQQAFQVATKDRPALYDTIKDIYTLRDAHNALRQEIRDEQSPGFITLAYSDLRHLMETQNIRSLMRQGPHGFKEWGQKASDGDLYAAAVDFSSLTLSIQQRLCYASMFIDRAFPLENLDCLFNLAYHTNLSREPIETHLAGLFLQVCSHISHPRLRAFALELIANRQHAGQAVTLLQNNFEVDDWLLIEPLFDADLNERDYHNLGFSIQKIFKKHPSSDSVPSLIRLFDANPCSRCRMDVVESLVSLNALPDWIAEECFYDANLDLRAYAERGFTHASDD